MDKYSPLQTLCVLYIETLLPFSNVVHERHFTLSHVMYLIDLCPFFCRERREAEQRERDRLEKERVAEKERREREQRERERRDAERRERERQEQRQKQLSAVEAVAHHFQMSMELAKKVNKDPPPLILVKC